MITFIKPIITFLLGIPIKVKINGIIFTLIAIIGISSLVQVRYSLMETMSIQMDERVKAIGRDLAARSADLMLTHNIYMLQQTASETLKNNKDVRYVFLLDEKDNIIVHTFGEYGISKELLEVNQRSSNESIRLQKFETEDGIIRDVAVLIIEGIGGTVRVGLTEEYLSQALSQVTMRLLLTMTIVFILAGFIGYYVTKLITAPITKLVQVTHMVSGGDMSVRAQVWAKDEIGKLTEAFNQMLDDLDQMGKERELYNQEIVLRNRELSLLNELRVQVRSVQEMRTMLAHFLEKMVVELLFNSAAIRISVLGETMELTYRNGLHPCDSCDPLQAQDCHCAITAISNYMVFPIELQETSIGQLGICSIQPLNEQSVKILHSLTHQIAVTVENLRLWYELKQKEELRLQLLKKAITAQEEERKRIARELHDETSQSLTSILIGLGVLSDKKDESERMMQIEYLNALMQQTLQEVHDLAWQLRPSVLDKYGLNITLERYIVEFRKNYSMDVDLCIVGIEGSRLHAEVEIAVYRLIQEALTNVARYAKARNVSVIVDKKQDLLTVIVEDDGIGFDVEKVLNREPSKHSLGLRGMQERALLLGGILEIESKFNQGTTIFVKIPLLGERGQHE